MDTSILKFMAFIKTVECGSFTKAAEVLNYSQSGISRMINDLENEWNITLLERNRAGVRLTSDGLSLLPYAKSVCDEYNKLQMQIDNLNGLQSGIIRIGTFSSVATHWLPNIIKEFQKDYPNIDYELLLGDYSEIEQWIAEGRVDCGFLKLPTDADFEILQLERDDFMAVLPENHPLAKCDEVSIASLCDEPFLMLGKGANGEVSKVFEKCGLSPNVRFTTWDDYSIMSMVESGLGVSILPKLILRRVPYHIVIKKLSVPAYRDIGFALRGKRNASLAVKKFMQYLQYK
jgi:DNA-binding transcriptional LysR family regulator